MCDFADLALTVTVDQQIGFESNKTERRTFSDQ